MEKCLSIITWHHLTLNLNNLKTNIVEYWNFKKIKIDLKEPEEQFHELLKKSLKLRLRSMLISVCITQKE